MTELADSLIPTQKKKIADTDCCRAWGTSRVLRPAGPAASRKHELIILSSYSLETTGPGYSESSCSPAGVTFAGCAQRLLALKTSTVLAGEDRSILCQSASSKSLMPYLVPLFVPEDQRGVCRNFGEDPGSRSSRRCRQEKIRQTRFLPVGISSNRKEVGKPLKLGVHGSCT